MYAYIGNISSKIHNWRRSVVTATGSAVALRPPSATRARNQLTHSGNWMMASEVQKCQPSSSQDIPGPAATASRERWFALFQVRSTHGALRSRHYTEQGSLRATARWFDAGIKAQGSMRPATRMLHKLNTARHICTDVPSSRLAVRVGLALTPCVSLVIDGCCESFPIGGREASGVLRYHGDDGSFIEHRVEIELRFLVERLTVADELSAAELCANGQEWERQDRGGGLRGFGGRPHIFLCCQAAEED